MLTFRQFILREAELIGKTNLPIRVDPIKTKNFDGERHYASFKQGHEHGSVSINKRDRLIGGNKKFSGTMTTTDHPAALRYTFPRGTHLIHYVDHKNNHHFSIAADSDEQKKKITSHKTIIRTTPHKIQKNIPNGMSGEKVTSTKAFNRAHKLTQHVNNPVEFAKNHGIKITFRTSKEQKKHAESLKKRGIPHFTER